MPAWPPGLLLGEGEELKADARRLESIIRNTGRRDPRSGTGALFQDHGRPRAQIFASSVDSASLVLQMDNACLAADDFRVKYEIGSAGYRLE